MHGPAVTWSEVERVLVGVVGAAGRVEEVGRRVHGLWLRLILLLLLRLLHFLHLDDLGVAELLAEAADEAHRVEA